MQVCWHYTVGERLARIIALGEIRTSTTGVRASEKPVVWFSTNPVWENTAGPVLLDNVTSKRIDLDKQQMHQLCGGLDE